MNKSRKEYWDVWYEKNSERHALKTKAWAKNHRTRYLQLQRDWRRKNKERVAFLRNANKDFICAQRSFSQLRIAQKDSLYKNGWPDVGATEQKIRGDVMRANQWFRAAWLLAAQGKDIRIAVANTHLDAALESGSFVVYPSIVSWIIGTFPKEYKIQAIIEWKVLLSKITSDLKKG